jgi:hypothetical protein
VTGFEDPQFLQLTSGTGFGPLSLPVLAPKTINTIPAASTNPPNIIYCPANSTGKLKENPKKAKPKI